MNNMVYNGNHLKEILKSGEKRDNQFSLGVEIEHFVVDKDSWDSVNYYQENGIEAILKKMIKYGYKPKYEGSHLIGLDKDDAVITIEPGGQLEISIRPCFLLSTIEDIYFAFLQEVIPILDEQNQSLVTLGYHPKSKIRDIPFIPKKRYELMSEYFVRKGKYAHNMMKGTAALQVSIDYRNEEDFSRKLKAANFISPLLAIIADNSPIFEGDVYNKNILRSLIWRNTDNSRSGTIPGVMDRQFGYQEYADYILNVEPILYISDKCLIDAGEMICSDVLAQCSLTNDELVHFFSMVFPDTRARNYIEIRTGDSLPFPYNFSYIALIKGLFYNNSAVECLYRMSADIDSHMLDMYKLSIMEKGLDAEFASKPVMEMMQFLFNLAKEGLTDEEKGYLYPLERLILSKKNPSQAAKEILSKKGFGGLNAWTLNDFVQEGNIHVDRCIV